MDFKDKVEGDVVVVSLSGKMMGGEDNVLCRDRLHNYLNSKTNKFVLDTGDVEWINSQGLGMLIGCYISVKKAGGNLVLANITNIRRILELTHLIRVFDCYDSVEAAQRSFEATVEQDG